MTEPVPSPAGTNGTARTGTAFEIVVEGAAGARTAQRAGADRVELVTALVDGGLTPSIGTVEAVLAAAPDIAVFPIVRPRGGDFVYDAGELEAMERDVRAFARAGAHGVVLGALTPDGGVDHAAMERLLAAAEGLGTTFHRAFDVCADPVGTLEELIGLGVDRVLTSGQQASAPEGAGLIAELVRRSAGRIAVMPGGGVREGNAAELVERTGARELHFSAMDTVPSPVRHRNPRVRMGGQAVPPEDVRTVNSAEKIVRVMRAVRPAAGG
ncbi:copper homeostasis protein CutC [Nocardiopsis halophila]|uniref:copper homeostasis protein CutC n=1 Tax=Nocardiopsis halophila TaxID=141692 RepID=UPI000349795F|nr:copper homeostasis protein CutC [Nocardiopsis halophila]